MPNRLSRFIAGAVLVSALGIAQPTPTDAGNFSAVAKENDPAKKLALLDQWTAEYPQTAFPQQRNLQYISGYSKLASNAAGASASAGTITAGQTAARAMLNKADALFAPDLMPDGVKAGEWAAARREFIRQAHSVMATIELNTRNYPAAEAELIALIALDHEMNRDDAATSLQLGAAIISEKMPDRYPVAIFHLAHAVTTTGPGAFDEKTRKSTEAYLENIYRNYHGDLSGLDEVKRASSVAWMPPAGWTIQSVLTISQEQRDAEEKFAREHPGIVVWRNLKSKLLMPDGNEYFAADVAGAEIPNLKGKVFAQPDARTLVVVIDDLDPLKPAEATLRFDSALKGKVEAGTVLDFSSVPQMFTKDPFMITMKVEKAKVRGLGDAGSRQRPNR
jgi:hypothetical protein